MRPGARSDCGFLGADESLHEVLASDAATLAELGVTARELANTLGLLVTAPDAVSAPRFHDRHGPQPSLDALRLEQQRRRPVFAGVVERFGSLEFPRRNIALVAKHYVVKLNLYLGIQECPWGPTEGKLCGAVSRDWQIRNTARGLEMSGSRADRPSHRRTRLLRRTCLPVSNRPSRVSRASRTRVTRAPSVAPVFTNDA